jgi:hypothetical protein
VSNPDKPDFVVVAIGARGKLSSRDAKDAVKLWRQLQREAPQASFRIVIAGYDEDRRPLWEIHLGAARRPHGARRGGASIQTVGRLFPRSHGRTARPLRCVFGDKPLFTRPEEMH